MAHLVIRQRWRTFPTPQRLSFSPYFHGRAAFACSVPPAYRRGRTSWTERFGIIGLLLLCMGCAGVVYQPTPASDSAQSAGNAPNMCLRAVSALPKPIIVASYADNTATFTATVVGHGSDMVAAVQIDYTRRFQRTQSVIAQVINGTAAATVSVDAGYSYNYTARSHGSPVGAAYYCSRFAEVKKIIVPDPAQH